MRTKHLLWAIAVVAVFATACSADNNDTPSGDLGGTPSVNEGIDEGVGGHYRIGDVYSRGSVTGVVFRIAEQGAHGLIVSPNETAAVQWACEEHVKTNATDMNSGKENMKKIEALADWERTFPAFKWCADLNAGRQDGWYLPSINELTDLYRAYNGGSIQEINEEEQANFNRSLIRCGGVPIEARSDGKPYLSATYWSSTVHKEYREYGLGECDVRIVDFTDFFPEHIMTEEVVLRVRAVHAF